MGKKAAVLLGFLALVVTVSAPAVADCTASWTSPPAAAPPPRWIAGMAYDAARERTVLFGGGGSGAPSAYLGDTWLWDGVAWTRAAQGAAAPEARQGGVLVYDERRERTVLFGGLDTSLPTGNNYFPGTWEWNGSSWTSAAAAGPGGRFLHAMAYDGGRGRVVLFGGDRDHTTLGDTWEFDGGSGTWSERATSGPTPRFAASLAYDRKRGVVVLFGGVVVPDAATGPQARNDTWEWDGAAWHERSLAGPLPSARYQAALVWDAVREALVLTGGTDGASDASPAVWELDASGWHERENAGTLARYGAGTAWDSRRERLVVFGGARGQTLLGDTWERRAPVPGDLLAPIVLEAFGVGGSHFVTEMSLTNTEDAAADVSLTYTASLGSGSGTVTERVEAGQQRVVADVLDLLRQKGLAIPPGSTGAQAGTLRAAFGCVASRENVALTVRVTSPTSSPLPSGRAGLAFTGERPPESGAQAPALVVHGLRANAADRSNIAVYNTSESSVTLRVTALSGTGDGVRVPIAAAQTLRPWGWFQWSFDATGLANGSVLVERTGGSGTFGAYGVVDDNVTNDGSILGAAPVGTLSSGGLQIPVLVETSRFTSELLLANGGTAPARLDLAYTESLADAASGTVSVTLAPGEERILPGAIDFLRRGGVPLGAAGAASRAGSVRVAVDPPSSSVYAGARTAAPAASGGQFGLFTPAVTPGTHLRDEAFLYGLRADAENRSNVAAVNAGAAADGAVTLAFEVHDGDDGGRVKGTPVTRTLQPGQWFQADGILAGTGVANGWVRVVRVSGAAPWLAYGVVNDGGQPGARTGDGAYVPMVARGD